MTQAPSKLKPKILLADDSSIARDLLRADLKTALKQGGFADVDLAEAENGAQVIEKVTKENFDLLLLDFYLPVADAETVLRKIRSTASCSKLPVIVVSSDGSIAFRAKAAGANVFLRKPVLPGELVSTIKSLIDGTPVLNR